MQRHFLITYTGSGIDGGTFNGNVCITTEGSFPSYNYIVSHIEVKNKGIIINNIFEFKTSKDFKDYLGPGSNEDDEAKKIENFKNEILNYVIDFFNFTPELAEASLKNKDFISLYKENLSSKEAFKKLYNLFKDKDVDEN